MLFFLTEFLKELSLTAEQIKVVENDKNGVECDSATQLFSFSKAILLHF